MVGGENAGVGNLALGDNGAGVFIEKNNVGWVGVGNAKHRAGGVDFVCCFGFWVDGGGGAPDFGV